jgi:hypothetical protein
MITLQLLEPIDLLQPNDWCRPLVICSMSGGTSDHYSFRNAYSGAPENNAKWVRAHEIFGPCWMGQPIGAMKSQDMTPYEFVRGDMPKAHQLNMRPYRS